MISQTSLHYLQRGQAHLSQHQLKQAIDCFKIALYHEPGNGAAAIGLEQASRSAPANAAPRIFLAVMPKSASVYLASALRRGLNLIQSDDGPADALSRKGRMITTGELQLEGGRFPDLWLNYALLRDFAAQPHPVIALTHLPPTPYNLAMLNRYLDRVVVQVRDPRQAILSFTHHFQELEAKEPLINFTYDFPAGYFDRPLVEQIDYQLDHWLPIFIEWLLGWLAAAENPGYQLKILFTRYEDLQADPRRFFEAILDFYHLARDAFHLPPGPQKGELHYRQGRRDEWREVFTPEQARRAAAMIPAQLLKKFGWEID